MTVAKNIAGGVKINLSTIIAGVLSTIIAVTLIFLVSNVATSNDIIALKNDMKYQNELRSMEIKNIKRELEEVKNRLHSFGYNRKGKKDTSIYE